MTVLSAIRKAVLRTVGTVPSGIFVSTDRVAQEFADLSNEVARDIVGSHDWRALTSIATLVADGVQTAYPLPDDYDRMVMASIVQDAQSWFWGYDTIGSVDEWIYYQNGGWQPIHGAWIILENQFQFSPAPTGNAVFPYITKNYAIDANGVIKREFTADDDTFRLDERLLTLGLISRWREQKGLDATLDGANYELALSQAQARDAGARIIRTASRYTGPLNTYLAWPGILGP